MPSATRPRKHPRQVRAKDTVEALLKATAELLEQGGYARLTTNHIAERAGVSIGSLYQYFPNKEALVAALIEQVLEEEWAAMEASLTQFATGSVSELAVTLIGRMLERVEQRAALHRVLMEQVPRDGRMARMLEFETRVAKRLSAYLSLRPEVVAPKDLDLAAFVIVQAVTSVIRLTVLHYPEYRARPGLKEELVMMALQYLTSPRLFSLEPGGAAVGSAV